MTDAEVLEALRVRFPDLAARPVDTALSVVVDGPDGHKVTSPTRHFAALSLEPSVRGTHHGPNRPCGLHVIIKNGQLLPAN